MKRMISCLRPAHILPWPIPKSEVNLSSILTVEPINVFNGILTFQVVQALLLSTSPCTPIVSSCTPTYDGITALVISLVARVVRLFIWQISMVVRLHPQLVKICTGPTTRDWAARKYLVSFILSLFSDNECIRPSSSLSFTRAISPPIDWLPTHWYILHIHTQKYISLPWRFPSTCLYYSRYDCPPRGYTHRCISRILGRKAASRGWFRNRLNCRRHTPPQTNCGNWPRLAFGVQLIEILMNPISVWLHGKYTPSSRCVFGLL